MGPDNKPYPGVAEKWESNPGNTEFTFTLRSGAKWADKGKTPVTAADFVFAFQRALLPATGSKTCTPMLCIKNATEVHSGELPASQLGVTARDDRTLVVSLAYPNPDFPALTASTVFMPCNQTFFESTSGRYGLEIKYLLGNGPFKIDGKYGWDHGKYLNLVRSDTYSGSKKPLPSNLKFSIGNSSTDVSDPIKALTSGAVDAIEIPSDKIHAARESGGTLTSFEDTTWGLCFNTRSDYMKNLNVRKAFLQAFSRAGVLNPLPQDIAKADYLVSPSATFEGKNYLSLVTGGPFYLKEDKNATDMLKSGLSELSLKELKSVSVIIPNNAYAKLMVNEMIASWNTKFSDYFNIEPLDNSTLAQRINAGTFHIALCPIQPHGSGPLDALSIFKSGTTGNPARLTDPAFDAILNDAQVKTGSDAVAAYFNAEKYLNQQGIFYPLYYEKHYYASAKGVTGIVFHPYGAGIDFIQAGKE